MKRIFLILIFGVILITGCENDSSSYDNLIPLITTQNIKSSSVEKTTMSESMEISYSPNTIYTVTGTSIKISGENIAGKTVYLAKVNETNSVIASQYYVADGTGISLNKTSSSRSVESIPDENDINESELKTGHKCSLMKNMDLNISFGKEIQYELDSSRTSESVEQIYNVDDKRNIGIDTGNSGYQSKQATLYAKTEDVYVWVVDDYANPYVAKNTRKTVTKEIAQEYATKMQAMYKYIVAVYSELPSKLRYSTDNFSTYSIQDMEKFSLTGTKINVVITDVDGDNSTQVYGGSTVGLTSLVDCMATDSGSYIEDGTTYISNMGNYFYLDSYYAIESSSESISVLAHEFQHLLALGYKTILNNLEFPTFESLGYAEMMSMICEDMMQDYLGLDDSEVAVARLPYFNKYYYLVGATTYNERYAFYTYSNNYAFGAWLVRNFGGTNLIHEMATNKYVCIDSIVNAVNVVNDKNYVFGDLLKLYTQALISNSSDSDISSMNKAAVSGISYEGYSYPLKPINLWKLDERLDASKYNKSGKMDGPYYIESNLGLELTSKAFSIHKIGVIEEGAESVTLTMSIGFSGSDKNQSKEAANKIKYYLMIQ